MIIKSILKVKKNKLIFYLFRLNGNVWYRKDLVLEFQLKLVDSNDKVLLFLLFLNYVF